MPVQPLKPSQVERKKHEMMPDGVIEAFNELIGEHWDGHSAVFTRSEAVAAILKKVNAGPAGHGVVMRIL